MPLAEGTLTVDTLTVSPVQTVLRATWRGVAPSDPSGYRADVPRLLQARLYSDQEPTQWGTKLLGPDGREATRAFWDESVEVAGPAGFVPDTPIEADYTMVFESLPPDLAEVMLSVGALVCVEQRTELPLATGEYVDAGGQAVSITEVSINGTTISATLVEDYDVRNQKPGRSWQIVCTDGSIVQPTRVSDYIRTDNWIGTRTQTITWKLPRGASPQVIIGPLTWMTIKSGEVTVDLK